MPASCACVDFGMLSPICSNLSSVIVPVEKEDGLASSKTGRDDMTCQVSRPNISAEFPSLPSLRRVDTLGVLESNTRASRVAVAALC